MRSARRSALPLLVTLGLGLGCGGGGGGQDDEMMTSVGMPTECGDQTLAGHLVIESEADLGPLSGVRAIEGELQINRTAFTDLDFLGCLEEVGGELTIFGNEALTDLSGLDGLQVAGAGVIVSENTALTDLAGLGELTEIGGNLIVRGNDSLRAISGLRELHTVGVSLIIRENDALEHIDGLRGLRTVGALFAVTHNPSLCITSVNTVGEGITDPAEPRSDWSTRANDEGC